MKVEVRMAQLYAEGRTYQEIADLYGMTRQGVQQLLKRKFGITRRDGGKWASIRKNTFKGTYDDDD